MISFFEKHSKLSWAITILGAITIFIISSLTFKGAVYPATGNLNATLYHLLAFFCLAFFLMISLLKGKKNYQLFTLGIFLLILYAALDELHQFFVPGRFCTFSDLILNSTGITLASLIYFFRINK